MLLDAGIDVLTTMNVQHLESLNDQIWQITGVRVRETIPDWVLKQADEVVMVDLTPRALLNRLARGVVYPPNGRAPRSRTSSRNRRSSPCASWRCGRPRMPWRAGCRTTSRRAPADAPRHRTARSACCSSSGRIRPARRSIRRGRRVADYLRADCLAVYVSKTPDLRHLADDERERLERHLNFARALQIETRVLQGRDVADTVVAFAPAERRHADLRRPQRTAAERWWFGRSLVERIVNRARGHAGHSGRGPDAAVQTADRRTRLIPAQPERHPALRRLLEGVLERDQPPQPTSPAAWRARCR